MAAIKVAGFTVNIQAPGRPDRQTYNYGVKVLRVRTAVVQFTV